MLQVDVFAVLFMNEFKNLTNVLFFINYRISIVQVRYITIETTDVVRVGY